MDLIHVMTVVVTVGGPSRFVLAKHSKDSKDSNAPETVLSSSVLVQEALVSAFLIGAPVEVELVPGSNTVRRVLPFAAKSVSSPYFPAAGYRVSRIATQRMLNGRDEHLEVFLVTGKDPEKAYNVYDPFLQQLIVAVFAATTVGLTGVVLYVEFDAEDIAMIRLGNP